MLSKTLDIGHLSLVIGFKFQLKDDVLIVPFGCTLDQVHDFLISEESKKGLNHD